MTDRAKKITELDALTTPAVNDLLIIEDDPSGTPATKKITVGNLLNSGLITSNGYAIANTTVPGVIKVGNQLTVNATGFLNTNLNIANTTTLGVIKVGDQLEVNATSFLNTNLNIANSTTLGVIKVGDQLDVNATGYLNANLNTANTTTLGVIKVGDYLSINATGFLNVTDLTVYQTNDGLSSNVITLTANNTLFVGSVSASNLVSNSQLSGNLSNYAELSGAIFTGNVTGNTAGYVIGYREVPQNFTNTSYTFQLTDAGKHVYTQNSGALSQVLTIANTATVAFGIGTEIQLVVESAGSINVAPGTGVSLYLAGNSTSASRTVNTYGIATLLKVQADTWFISGTNVS